MTYRSLARHAWLVARSHARPHVKRARRLTRRTLQAAALILIVSPPLIELGASRANARCVAEKEGWSDALRRVVPVSEAALAAHKVETAALADTLGWLSVVEDGS